MVEFLVIIRREMVTLTISMNHNTILNVYICPTSIIILTHLEQKWINKWTKKTNYRSKSDECGTSGPPQKGPLTP